MEESDNKTITCSILFLEIVGYSRKAVMDQIALRDKLNSYLSAAISNIPPANRIIFDTGDGLAINFLGDVDDAFKVALSLRENLEKEAPEHELHILLRMGINLGPVRLVRGAHGQPTIVGDGINVAQRVMSFADENQILVSRSYFDAVSRHSPQYAGMFRHQGSRTDKHVREHEVFSVASPEHSGGADIRSETTGKLHAWLQATPLWHRVLYVVLLIALAMLLVLLPGKIANHEAAPEVRPTGINRPDAAKVIKPPVAAMDPVIEKTPDVLVDRPANPSANTPTKAVTKPEPKKAARAREAGMAQVKIVAIPWGEVYLDGKIQGVSPPLTELNVPQGKHKIEIRNTIFPSYTQSIQVKAGDRIKIRHKFAN
jgi:class 3 adenylate cyclase